MILAALQEPSDKWVATLFDNLSAFSFIHYAALRTYLSSGISRPESAITDINQAFIAVKLWLMLAQRVSTTLSNAGGDVSIEAPLIVWNELWPPFESLMSILEIDAQATSLVRTKPHKLLRFC